MLSSLYTTGVRVYAVLIKLAAFLNPKAKLMKDGHKAVFPYLNKKFNNKRETIWVHSASLGEFEQGRPIIEQIKRQYPSYQIVLTFYSPSGYEVQKKYKMADHILYLPFDLPKNVSSFISTIKPKAAFFIKYEYWPNYFGELHSKNIPIYMVSAIFRKNQIFFKQNFIGNWFCNTLSKVNFFFIQNKESAQLLNQLGYNNYEVTGDTRFDRVKQIADQGEAVKIIEHFKANKPLLVVGSSWKPDELLIRPLAESGVCKTIFAPHEIKSSNIERLQSFESKTILYSEATPETVVDADILIIDNIGLLSRIYRYADFAYIGGGFGVGIHNTLEAAIFNIPIFFGPNYKKFAEAVELIQRGIAQNVNSTEELSNAISFLLNNKQALAQVENTCQQFTEENIGATQIIINKVFNNTKS